jgi:site-specific recombinase XerD
LRNPWEIMLQAPRPKGEQLSRITVKRKISALRNYFYWLVQEQVIRANPAEYVYTGMPQSPLPLLLTESECQYLLSTSQYDPRPYLILKLLLETGMKLEELLMLSPDHFDFSNKYIPEVWIANATPKRSRKLKLPGEIAQVFTDYLREYATTDKLFPYTDRFVRHLIADAVSKAEITKPVSAKILRDTYVVLRLKRGESIELLLQRIGLDPEKSTDAREKYEKLARAGI